MPIKSTQQILTPLDIKWRARSSPALLITEQFLRSQFSQFSSLSGDHRDMDYTIAILCISILGASLSGVCGQDASGITSSQFRAAVTSNGYPAPSDAQYRAYMAGLPKGLITTKQEAAMALTQFIHESDGLRAKREYACAQTGCPGRYVTAGCDVRGQHYYGRGYIQLTWCSNYKPASQDLFGDDRLVRDPDQVARDEQTAWDTAFWFWKKNVHSRAGVAEGKFGVTTKAINGGECKGGGNAAAHKRYKMYGKVRAAFGLPGNGNESGCYN